MRVSTRVSRAYLSAVDQEAKLDSPIRVETSSESFGSATLVAKNISKVRCVEWRATWLRG